LQKCEKKVLKISRLLFYPGTILKLFYAVVVITTNNYIALLCDNQNVAPNAIFSDVMNCEQINGHKSVLEKDFA
jgi:hypothetical protein